MLIQFCCFLMLIASFVSLAFADVYEECEGRDQTYVAVQEDCSYYIFCHGEESFSDACPEESPYFSEDEQTCDSDRNACGDRAVLIEDSNASTKRIDMETTTTAAISAPTKPLTGVSIIIPTHGSNLTSTSPFPNSTASVHTSAPSIPTLSLTSLAPQTVTTLQPSPLIPSSCPAVDNPNKAIFLPHSKSCSEYFLCYHGQRLPMHCSNMLHFSVRQQKCDYPENVKCHMMDVASPREQCLSHTYDFYPHPRNCNYFYQCTLGYLKVMQCPLNMGWHFEKRTCVRRSQAKCYNSFARS